MVDIWNEYMKWESSGFDDVVFHHCDVTINSKYLAKFCIWQNEDKWYCDIFHVQSLREDMIGSSDTLEGCKELCFNVLVILQTAME